MSEADTSEQTTSSKYIWGFLVATFLWSWSFWLASGVLPRRGLGAFDFRWLLAQIGVIGPSLAALLLSGVTRKELRSNSLRILPALLFPLVLPGVLIAASAPLGVAEFEPFPSVVTVLVSLAVLLFFWPLIPRLSSPGTGERYCRPGAQWILLSFTFLPGLFLLAWLTVYLQGGDRTLSIPPGGLARFSVVILVSFSHNLLLGGSLGEEIGWRGFLLPELLKRNNPLRASLVLGVIWALWHLPIDFYGGSVLEAPAAILIRMIFSLALAILFTWFYLRSRGNLLVALLLHTSINFLPDLGVPQYEAAMIRFFIFMAIAALILSAVSPVFKNGSR